MKMDQLLRLVADMERFSPRDDALSALVREEEDEMSCSALELVSAAGGKPPFSDLLRGEKRPR